MTFRVVCEHDTIVAPDRQFVDLAVAELRDRHGDVQIDLIREEHRDDND